MARLTFLALNVSDLEASTDFYQLILGTSLTKEDHDAELGDRWYGGDHAACTWTDGAFIHFALYPATGHRPVSTATQVGFHVDNFDEIHAALVTAGAEVVQEPREEPWGRTSRYLDPDRNIVSITQDNR